MFKNITQKKSGYTLIETVVAIAIFSIIVLIGINALINANIVGQKGKDLRNVIDNFNFAVEDRSRNIRDGDHYRCYDVSNPWDGTEASNIILETPRSCATGKAIIFENNVGITGNASDQWGYKLSHTDSVPGCGDSGIATRYNLCKTVDGGSTWLQLNPPEIQFTTTDIFLVLGAEDYPTDRQHPLVTMKILGEIIYKSFNTNLSIQTTVSQRYIEF